MVGRIFPSRKGRWKVRRGIEPSFHLGEHGRELGQKLLTEKAVVQEAKVLRREEVRSIVVRVRSRRRSLVPSYGDVEVGLDSRLLRQERLTESGFWPGRMCLGLDHMLRGRNRIVGSEEALEARFECVDQTSEEGCLVVWGVCLGDAEREDLMEGHHCRRRA